MPRLGHYLLLVTTWAVVCLPNLGGPSLWDIDEGNNATCAYEMRESGNYVRPTFNAQLRVDKPALLYWLQALAYEVFGVNEFAARLPSALAALLTLLLTYELGQSAFGATAGLLSGVVLASSPLFAAAAHFANPDALLVACTTLALWLFWRDYPAGGRSWFVGSGAACGLGMLAKGPVGLVLPLAVVVLFLLWERQLRRLGTWRLLLGMGAFFLVAAPWYLAVGAETKFEWLRGFFFTHNLDRFRAPMESHGGPAFYYLAVLCVGLAPWSVFLALAGWSAVKTPRRSATRFLVCWVAVFLGFFSLSGTKLPNYVLPLYPAAAVLLGAFLDRWRRGEWNPPAWAVHACLALLPLMGIGLTVGLVIGGRRLPGLEAWAPLGGVLVAAALLAWWCLEQQRRGAAIGALGVCSVLFAALLLGPAATSLEPYKAPRALAEALPDDQTRRDVRVGTFDYFQPSFVFYCRREVQRLPSLASVLESLRGPLPAYAALRADAWESVPAEQRAAFHLIARRHDFYRRYDVVLVGNERPKPAVDSEAQSGGGRTSPPARLASAGSSATAE